MTALDESEAHVAIAEGVVIRVARGAVGQVVHEDDLDPEEWTGERVGERVGDREASEES